jgi:hypothetical protein
MPRRSQDFSDEVHRGRHRLTAPGQRFGSRTSQVEPDLAGEAPHRRISRTQ